MNYMYLYKEVWQLIKEIQKTIEMGFGTEKIGGGH